jgi:hypothetical protein
MAVLVALVGGAAARAAPAPPGQSPAGGAAVDGANAVWVLRFAGVIPDPSAKPDVPRDPALEALAGRWLATSPKTASGYDLEVYLACRDGKFQQGLGWSLPKQVARPLNKMTHEARPTDLAFADGGLAGGLQVTVNADLWVPAEHRPLRGEVVIEAKADAARLAEEGAVRGRFTADFGGRTTEGDVVGRCFRPESFDMQDFSTRLSIYNGWINEYEPMAKRLVLGLNFRGGRAAGVKLGALNVWGNDRQITYLGEAPGAAADVSVTPGGFQGRVTLTQPDYGAPAGAPPARYTFDLKAVGVQGKFGGTVAVTMARGDRQEKQEGWFEGAWEPPWKVEPEPAEPEPTLTVNAELLEKCAQPRREELGPYMEAIGVYVYRVLKVREGDLKDERIGVAHWVLKRLLAQPVTEQKPGEKVTLRLCPLGAVDRSIQTVYRKEVPEAALLPCFYDCDQKLVYPEGAPNRWSYNVELSPKFPLMFRLKDQLKLVTLGDCQAWYANRAELYMGEENRTTPCALNLCQKRSGIDFQKLMIETYFVRMPKLEWIVVTWNPRWLTATWAEHGVKGRELERSPGFQYDKQHLDELFKPASEPPLTVQAIEASPLGGLWRSQPWGWHKQADAPAGNQGAREMQGYQRRLGTFMFVPERWAEFESVVKHVVQTSAKIKFLVYTQPVHPSSAGLRVKDKLGTDPAQYQFQVSLMKGLEQKYPDRFFFYDLNNMGASGLESGDFRDSDHVSGRGARRVSEKVERFRQECEARLAAGAARNRQARVPSFTLTAWTYPS